MQNIIRRVYDFEKYNDFLGNKVKKQTLASLCVTLREIVKIYDQDDEDLKKTLLDVKLPDASKLQSIVTARDDRKKKLFEIVEKVLEKRNKGFSEPNLLKAKAVLDVFRNLHEETDAEGDSEKSLEDTVLDLRAEIDVYKAKVAEANKTLLERDRGSFQDVESASNIPGHATTEEGVLRASTDRNIKGTYKLDAKTPVFQSRIDEDVDKWLIRMEASLTFANVPQELWITASYNYVEGIALEMVIAAKKNNQTWSEFKLKMEETFRPVNKMYDLRAKLLQLKDVGNFDKYLFDFRTLENQIPLEEMGETDRFTCFMAGLQSKTRGEILRLKVTTLDVAIKTANQLNAERNQERELGSLNYLKVNENKGKIKEKQRKCFKCGGVGHIQRDCPSNSIEAESSENEVIDDNDEVKKDDNSDNGKNIGKY